MTAPIILHRTVDFTVCEHNTDDEVARISVRMKIAVTLGEPESGRFGPPENYDPGSDDEIWIKACDVQNAGGVHPLLIQEFALWAEKWLEINRDSLSTEARETDNGPDPDDARDALRDAQLEADAAWRRGP